MFPLIVSKNPTSAFGGSFDFDDDDEVEEDTKYHPAVIARNAAIEAVHNVVAVDGISSMMTLLSCPCYSDCYATKYK